MLLSLEMLLRKAEEWEKFAAKHSSLQAEMTILSELIAMWRELELKSWQQLLRTKELEYSDDALNYWFVLAKTLNTLPDVLTDEVVSDVPSKWPSLVRDASIWIWGQQYHSSESVIEPNPTDPKQTHPTVFIPKQFQAPVVTTETSSLKTTFDTLDGFLRSSNVGQFPTRLHLVRLFALQLSQEALHSSGSSSDGGQSGYDVEEMKTQLMNAESTAGLIEKVSLTDLPVTSTSDSDNKSQQAVITYKKNLARVVFGIWEFYQQYLSVVRKFQDTLKAPLQVKAKDQANIGKWDKINSYALIEHSERVHRKLNTLLREYQYVMEYPISAVLSREIMRGFTSDTGDLAAANLIPSTKDTFPQVLVLGECLPTYKPIVDTQDDDVDNEEEGEVEVEVEVVVKAQNKVTPTIDVSDEPDPATIIHISDTGSQFLSRYTSSKHQQSRSFIFTVSESLHSPILETFPRLQRVGKLCKKTDTIVTELLYIPEIKLAQGYQPDLFIGKVRYGIQGAFLAEELSLEVFSRLDSLRATHVNKSMKYRAVADLLSSLKEQGISPYLGTVPAQCRSMQQVLSSSAPLVCESAGDLAWFVDSPKNVVEHGERYFVRNSSELNQMRTQVAAPSARDVPLRDAQLMLGLSENFFFQSLKTRSVLAASLTDLKEIAVTLRTVDSFSELPSTLKTSYPSSSTASTTDVSVFAIEKCAMLKSQLAAEAYFQYFSPSCSLIVKGIHELLSLVRVGVISHSDQMIEEATVLPVVDRVQSQEAIGKLTKVIDTLVSARDSILSSSTSTGAHASNQLVVGYYCPLSEPQSLNRTLKSVRDTYAFASKSLNLLLEVRECVGELVTTNVCDSVIKKVEEWLSTLQSHHAIVFPSVESEIASISVNTADPRASDDMSSSILTHLSQCVDECLLAVQKVQSLANLRCLSAYDAALQQGRPTTDSISGCFGETFVRKSASVISSATDVEISDGADVTEATLSDCVSLGQTSVASVGIHLHRINQHLLTIISYFQSDCTSNNSNILSHSILTQAVLELVSRVKDIFAAQVDDLCSLYKSQNKFLYVCLRIFRTLLAKGLCSDETKEGDGDGDGNGGDMTFEDDVDGTGMGEGEGRKDVSDQIETEDQLMGLKNQNELEEESKAHNQESKKMDDKEEDNAVEMTQDFDGEMYDMPADERDQNKDDDDDDEGIDQEELEREIGEADKDDIVDEKQWDNDDEEDEGGTDGKKETFEKDSQMKGPSLEDELRTKEDDEDDGSEKGDNQEGEPESDKKKEEQPRDHDADDGKGEDKINQQDDEEVLDKPMGVDVEEKKPKPDTSDDVDDNDKDEGDEGGDEGLDPNGENDIDNGDDAADGDDLPDDMNLDADDNDNQDDEDQNEDTADDQMNEDMIDTEVPEPDNQSDAMEEDTAEDVEGHGHQPQSGTGNIPDEQNPGDEEKPDEEMKPEKPLSKNLTPKPSRPPTFGDASADGDDAIINDEMQAQIPRQKEDTDDNFEGAADGPKGENSMTESAGRDGAAQSLGDQESNPMQQKIPRSEKPRDAPNPFRPGDVNEKWHRHLNMLDREEEEDDDTDEVIADPEKSNNESSQQVDKKKPKGLFEKASDNEESSDQVMDSTQDYDSPIPAPQHAAEDTNITEGNDDMKDEANDDDPMNSQPEISKDNEEETLSETRKRKKDSEKETSKVPRYKSAKKSKDETAQKNQESDRMLDDEDNHSTSDQDSDDEMSDNDEDSNESMNGDESNQLKTSKDMIHANNNFQFTKSSMTQSKAIDTMNDIDNEFVSKISLDDQNLILSRQLWSQYRQSTEAQSQRLCEQLRLILEATVASRLRGDYRTGKRLNMRKIISYVASGFRKDKIWLRRTEPAKREYQVMIMVDNSKSMTEAGPLAFSALSVITNALTKLEVGEVSLLSFAEQVHIVHPFGTPFDDEAGARAFAHFDFSAGRTLLGRSLDAVGPIFADALQASSSGGSRSQTGTTLQLCFVISDARIDSDNRQQLESTIRNLAEQNVLVLLVIIDQNINQGDSIFNTRSVEFVGNKVVTRAYMDSFPFPYYIVIQQVEGLSDVLSEALKQWFEMIRHQSGR